MPEIILITLAKNLFHVLKNEVGKKKIVKGGVHPPINPSPINDTLQTIFTAFLKRIYPFNKVLQFMGGVHPPSRTFFISDFVLQDTKRKFCQCYQNYLRHLGFMGGCTPPPFTIFFDFRLRSLRYEKDFLPVLSKLSHASMIKIFHFSD